MIAFDVMTPSIVSASSETPVREIALLMLQQRIDAVLILDLQGKLVGIVTEGDLLRRCESGTERRQSRWIELFRIRSSLAAEYVKSHGRLARHVMTRDVVTVDENTPLHTIADIFETHRIKRVPVMQENQIVGIVSRVNLLHALVAGGVAEGEGPSDDRSIRARLLLELKQKAWRPNNVIVRNGVVHIWGEVSSEVERDAMRVAAENTPGVRGVQDHTWYPDTWLGI